MSPPTAERVLDCVRRFPGIHLRGIERELGLSSALVHYHVKGLEARGEIVSALVGGYLRFYPKGIDVRKGLSAADEELLAALREEVPLHIALLLLERGSAPQSALVDDLGLAKSTVSYHVEKLVQRGVILRKEGPGGERALKVKDPRRVRRLLSEYAPTPDMLEKFRDLWDDFYGR